jgi:glycosyltransferase involved in cell wall biosynthesis
VRRILAPPPDEALLEAGAAPTFSAIVAAYQAASFIGDALDSLLAQTVPPLEIIVCDDGSTDNLDAALEPYRPHIELLRKENGGEASAKNLAARAASGDFLAILDADDVYFPERLEALAELSAQRPDLDIVTTDCRVMVDGRFVRNCYQDDFPVGDQRSAIVRGNFVGPGHMAVRRAAFLEVGGFDESLRWATDWDCWIRMIFAGSRVGLVDEPLAEYRIRETGLASDRTRLIECRVALLEKAARRNDLSGVERALLDHTLEEQRRLLSLYSTRQALVESRRGARRLALSLALDRGFPWPARLKAALAIVLPRRAGRYLAERDRDRREVAGGITL